MHRLMLRHKAVLSANRSFSTTSDVQYATHTHTQREIERERDKEHVHHTNAHSYTKRGYGVVGKNH